MAANDYFNIALRGNDAADLLPSLLSGAAYVASVAGGAVIFPESDPATPDYGDFLAHALSAQMHGIALLSEVSGDVLRLRLFKNGATIDEYIAETPDDDAPTGGNTTALLSAFGTPAGDSEFLSPLLRAGRFDDDYGYGAASDRHAEIADLLGIPAIAGIGYEAITQGKLPDGVSSTSLRQVAGDGATRLYLFALIHAPEGTSETEIASYVLPDMVSLERGIETDDWTSDFGTRADVLSAIARAAEQPHSPGTDWSELAVPDRKLFFDFVHGQDADRVEVIRVFLTVPPGAKEAALPYLADVAQAIGGTIWDWETRRTNGQ